MTDLELIDDNEVKSGSDSLIDAARELESEGTAQNGPQPKIKVQKKRGPKGPRKKKVQEESLDASDKKETPKFDVPTKVLAYPLIKVVSVAGVNFAQHPSAALTPDEAEQMAEALGMIIDKYAPDLMSKYGPELALGAAMGQYGLRVYATRRMVEKARREAAEKASMANAARPEPSSRPMSNLQDDGDDAMI